MSGYPGGVASQALKASGVAVITALPSLLRPSGIMALRIPFIEKIWRATGTIKLPAEMTADEAFDRLDPLFQAPGTRYVVEDDTLSYAKRNPAAQDKLATFTHGNLRIEGPAGARRLRFEVASTALLLSFLAPLLFLAFAQLAEGLNSWEKATVEASADEGAKEKDKPKPIRKLNPIDEMLGAPQPEDPNKKKDKEKDEGPHSSERAYYLAGIFLAIFLVGRALEPWLLRRTFRKAFEGEGPASGGVSG